MKPSPRRKLRRRRLLIVEQDLVLAEQIDRMLSPLVLLRVVDSASHARRELEACGDWAAFIVGGAIADDDSRLVEEIRHRYPTAPLVITEASADAKALDVAFSYGAAVLPKPPSPAALRRLAIDMLAPANGWRALATHVVADMSARHGLSAAEAHIVLCAACGLNRVATMANRGISMSTYKTHVSHLLRKTQMPALGDLRDAVLRTISRVDL
jgi:DNA-binding NarL/FixJ family response regulator